MADLPRDMLQNAVCFPFPMSRPWLSGLEYIHGRDKHRVARSTWQPQSGTAYRPTGIVAWVRSAVLWRLRRKWQFTLVGAFPVEAVDANLSHDRWLLIVTTEGVLVLDVDLLVGQPSSSEPYEEGQEVRPTPMEPAWATQEREASIAGVA